MHSLVVIEKLKTMCLENKELSFGEILYSFLREKNSRLSMNEYAFILRHMENNEYYTLIERANKIEKNEE